jgi:carbamoyltransferase
MLYGAFTHHLGFKVNSGEYKVMGLAPYGQPRYLDQIFEHLVDLKADGSFRLDQQYFDYCTGLRMTNERFDALFGGPRRPAEAELTPRHFDIAASIQAATERIALAIARHLAASDTTGNLCLAGGVALNCVANRKILQHSGFKKIWIQPAAGDAGNALGAALVAHHHLHGQDREPAAESDAMQGCYLGPAYAQNEVEARLAAQGAVFSVLGDEALMAETAQSLAQGQVVGWFQGRMEFGPRALGNRSILADPRSAQMQRDLNLKVKFRESFRPFAPSVLAEAAGEWFDLDRDSPYMLFVAPVHESRRLPPAGAGGEALPALERLMQPRSTIPAVTHLDHSARVQTVHQDTNPRFHRLLSAFQSRTGCPVLVNTSFNVRGEPIVNTPEEAFVCFMTTGIDVLVVGNCLLTKTAQTVTITDRPNFAPD